LCERPEGQKLYGLRWQELTEENKALRADAARYQWLKPRFRTFSLDMGGQHTYCATGEIGRIRGPNLDMAIDAAIAARQKEGV
jgi:hypothetical protein